MDLATLSRDPFLAPFLAENFNADAYTRSVIRTVRPCVSKGYSQTQASQHSPFPLLPIFFSFFSS